MTDETYNRYHSGRYEGVEPKAPPEKNKFLKEVEKNFDRGRDAGKLRDKTKKALEEIEKE